MDFARELFEAMSSGNHATAQEHFKKKSAAA